MKRIYYILFFATTFFSCEKPISDFQSENFIKVFGSGYESKGNDVIELSGGGYLLTGYDKLNGIDQQIFVAKVDENGNLVWSKTFGEPENIDEGKIVKEVSNGYLIAGTSKNDVTKITHSFILKIDSNGEQVYFKQFGDVEYSITVNDIITTGTSIYVAGFSESLAVGKTDYFISKLNDSGETILGKSYSIGKNCSFKKIFIKDDKLILVGNDLTENKISITPYNQNSLVPDGTVGYPGALNESAVDASLSGDQLYLLTRGSSSNSKLIKLISNFSEEWHYDPTISIEGKSIVHNVDGSFIICAESVKDQISSINFIKVNSDGTVYNNDENFRTFLGTVGRAIQTKDDGIILVGTTNETYGKNIQLIKTDKDYFMLKNN